MLAVSNVSKRYSGAEVYTLRDVSFTVAHGQRVGLIGPNGSGKTTLVRIILGELQGDTGSVSFTPANLRIGYLPQGLIADESSALRDVLFPTLGQLHAQEQEVERLAAQIAEPDVTDAVYESYDAALRRLQTLHDNLDETAGYHALNNLGMGNVSLQTPVHMLSGGQKTRALLASLAASNPQLLLLDEPTNHLDAAALAWLQAWVINFEGGVLAVSHDRGFLDSVVNKIVALSGTTPESSTYDGNYTQYRHTIQASIDRQWKEWREQQDEITRLQADVSRTMAKAARREQATKNDFQRRRAKIVARKGKAKEKRLERYLQSDERVEKPQPTWHLNIDVDERRHINEDAVQLEAVSIGYPGNLPLLENMTLSVKGREHIAVIGPNGCGKTTLLKTIAGETPPLAGRVLVSGSTQLGYLSQEQDVLEPDRTALETIQQVAPMTETEARSFLHLYLFTGDDSLRRVANISFGERTRLMLARLVAGGANLLIMDEPLNHLDIDSRERFEAALLGFPGSILMVVHDRYFVDHFADSVWHIETGSLQVEIIRQATY